MTTTAKFTATVSERDAAGHVTVTAFANGKRVHAWSSKFTTAQRLARAVEAGVAFDATDAYTCLVNGERTTFPAGWSPKILGRYMNADLKALGF